MHTSSHGSVGGSGVGSVGGTGVGVAKNEGVGVTGLEREGEDVALLHIVLATTLERIVAEL